MALARRFEGERRDPYRNFNFRIFMGDVEVAACSKMSALDASVSVVKFRAGNSASSVDESMPGRTEYSAVTFEGGVTTDPTFKDWAYTLLDHGHEPGREVRQPEEGFRRDIDVKVLDVDGTAVRHFKLYKCFVSKFTHISDLQADGNDVLIETLEVTHEGFSLLPAAGGGAGE